MVDRHRYNMAAKFGVFVDKDHSKLRYTGYQNLIKDPICHVLLLMLKLVLLQDCLSF